MNRLLSFLFNQRNQTTFLTELVRAARVLSKKNISGILVVDMASVKNDQPSLINSIELVSNFVRKKRESLVIEGQQIVDSNITPPFPENIYYHSLTDRQLACLGISQTREDFAILVEKDGKISLAYQSSIKTDLNSAQLESIIRTITNSSYEQKKVLAVSSSSQI